MNTKIKKAKLVGGENVTAVVTHKRAGVTMKDNLSHKVLFLGIIYAVRGIFLLCIKSL